MNAEASPSFAVAEGVPELKEVERGCGLIVDEFEVPCFFGVFLCKKTMT